MQLILQSGLDMGTHRQGSGLGIAGLNSIDPLRVPARPDPTRQGCCLPRAAAAAFLLFYSFSKRLGGTGAD